MKKVLVLLLLLLLFLVIVCVLLSINGLSSSFIKRLTRKLESKILASVEYNNFDDLIFETDPTAGFRILVCNCEVSKHRPFNKL